MKNSGSSFRMYLLCYILSVIIVLLFITLFVSFVSDLSPQHTEDKPLEHMQIFEKTKLSEGNFRRNSEKNEDMIIRKTTDTSTGKDMIFMRSIDAAGNINLVEIKRGKFYEYQPSSIVIVEDERGKRWRKHPH